MINVIALETQEEFESLLEDLEDLAVIAERRNEPSIAHSDIVAELKKEGIIKVAMRCN